jgi:DegV family protein with EDD domain
MQQVALVTDSTAGLPPQLAEELGIITVPSSFAFAEERMLDGSLPWDSVYERMAASGVAPRSFGVAEAAFRTAFEAGLERFGAVFCLVTPFDVNPSFTTACAAMLAIQFDQPEARIKVANAGVGSAGLGALMISLAEMAVAGASTDDLVTALDELEPQCDSLFVPESVDWLERAGRLPAIEERLGAVEDGVPILRIGTRITGVALSPGTREAERQAVETVGKRAGGAALNVLVLHAHADGRAKDLADAVQHRWPVARIEIAELPATHGSNLGPGAVGIGVCPSARQGD